MTLSSVHSLALKIDFQTMLVEKKFFFKGFTIFARWTFEEDFELFEQESVAHPLIALVAQYQMEWYLKCSYEAVRVQNKALCLFVELVLFV